MTLENWQLVLLFASAFAAGVMNSIAGGGTLLTFPTLMSILGPEGGAIANATSTIALLPGTLASAVGYKKELRESRAFAIRMLGPSLLGGFLGAWLVCQDQQLFSELVPWLLLTAATLFLLQKPLSKWLLHHRPDQEPGRFLRTAILLFQFLIALYGGYFGAGIGILMLTALGFLGVGNFHQMNGVKSLLASVINLAAVIVFLSHGSMVNWHYASVMALASIIGGFVGARSARKIPAAYARGLAVAIGFGLALFYFVRRTF